MKQTITVEHEIEFEGEYCMDVLFHEESDNECYYLNTEYGTCNIFPNSDIRFSNTDNKYLRCPECIEATAKRERVLQAIDHIKNNNLTKGD